MKTCLFHATNIVKYNVQGKWVNSGYEIAFDGKGEWNFDNDFARNVITFGGDNSSSSHADNWKNNLFVLSERPNYGVNGSFGASEKIFSINVSKGITNFFLKLHYNGVINYFFVNGILIFKFKANNRNINFPTQICLGSISNKL